MLNIKPFHFDTIVKWLDVKHHERFGRRSVHLLSLGDKFHVRNNFDLTSINFRWDIQRLEERGLRRILTRWSSRNGDVRRSFDTSFSSCLHLLRGNLVTHGSNVFISWKENKTNVSLNHFQHSKNF